MPSGTNATPNWRQHRRLRTMAGDRLVLATVPAEHRLEPVVSETLCEGGHGLGTGRHLSRVFCARRSDTPTHPTARARKEPKGSTPKAGSCQTAKDDGGKPGVRFLARSKRGTRFRTASLLGGTKQRRRRFWTPLVGRDQGRRRCWWRSPDVRTLAQNSRSVPTPGFRDDRPRSFPAFLPAFRKSQFSALSDKPKPMGM